MNLNSLFHTALSARLGRIAAGAFMLAGLAAAQQGPTLAGCPVLPPDNFWNTPVDKLRPDPSTPALIQSIGAEKPLHADFGAGLNDGAPIGIPITIIPGNQRRVPIKFAYADDSDLSNYPIPPDVKVEGGPQATSGDRHILLVDKDNCVLWEIFGAQHKDGVWQAGSGATFDMKCNCLRQDGRTSADAAGLPILPGLVRYEEVEAGEIRHAIRFTVPRSRNQAIWPARHAASKLADSKLPAMGQRFRLKAGFDISGFPPQAQIVLKALKKYGMVVADNGSPWFLSGTPDERWKNGELGELKRVHGSDFEVVDGKELFVTHNSARAKQ